MSTLLAESLGRQQEPVKLKVFGPEIRKPKILTDTASRVWDDTVPELGQLVDLSIADVPVLIAYCQSFADYIDASAVVKTEGQYLTDATGRKYLHPAVRVASEALAKFTRLIKELPASPLSRKRMNVNLGAEDGTDKELLG